MSVYVDDLFRCRWGPRNQYTHAAHLIADSIPELVEFGRKIGLKRKWLQNEHDVRRIPHFDVTPGKRDLALAFGARAVDRYEFVAITRRIREQRLAQKGAGHGAVQHGERRG